jgi:cell division protein FtsX
MPEFDDRLDDRLRAALGDLGDAAQQQVRPAGVGVVTAAGRRRRMGLRAAGTALALVLVGGLPTGWWLVRNAAPAGQTDSAAAPGCVPARGSAILPLETTDQMREQVGAILRRSSEVASTAYESKEEAYRQFKEIYRNAPDLVNATRPESLPESWRFELRCATDFPAVSERLDPLPGVEVVCSCEPLMSDRPADPDDVLSNSPPTSPTPRR